MEKVLGQLPNPQGEYEDNITTDLQKTDYGNHTSRFITSCSTRHLAQAQKYPTFIPQNKLT